MLDAFYCGSSEVGPFNHEKQEELVPFLSICFEETYVVLLTNVNVFLEFLD